MNGVSGMDEREAIVVLGPDAAAVQAAAAALRAEGASAVAAFVGADQAAAREMGEDLFPNRPIEVRTVPPEGAPLG